MGHSIVKVIEDRASRSPMSLNRASHSLEGSFRCPILAHKPDSFSVSVSLQSQSVFRCLCQLDSAPFSFSSNLQIVEVSGTCSRETSKSQTQRNMNLLGSYKKQSSFSFLHTFQLQSKSSRSEASQSLAQAYRSLSLLLLFDDDYET